MNLADLLAAIRDGGGEFPDTFLDDASAAYDADMGVMTGKVDAVSAELEQLRAENLALKSHNYDLIMAGATEPGADEEPPAPEGEEDGEGGEDNEESESIGELFNEH